MTDRLIIDGFEIDLTEGVPVPFNFSISDVKEPNKRKRNFSKTIETPGTENNMAAFYSAFSLSLSDVDGTSIAGFNFDPTARAKCQYYSNDELVFQGVAKLNSTTTIKGVPASFILTLLSDFTELFIALNDLKLSELGWEEYQHTLTRTIVRNSMDTSVLVNGVATANFTGGQPDGFGYLYGLVDYGYARPSTYTFRTNDIAPLVYAREAFIKCLQVLGIKYTGNFIDSDLFKTVVIGWGGGDKTSIPPIEVSNRRTRFNGDFSHSYSVNAYSQFNQGSSSFARFTVSAAINLIDSDAGWFTPTVLNDTYSQYDDTTGAIVIQKTGNYRLAISQTINLTLTPSGMSPVSGTVLLRLNTKKNGSILKTEQVLIPAVDGSGSLAYSQSIEIQATSGDVLTVDLSVIGTLTYDTTASGVQPLTVSLSDSPNMTLDLTSINTSLGEGDTVDLSRFVPDMRAADFAADIINMFNLTISDPDIFDTVSIDTTIDFYSDTSDFDDWSDLVDDDKPIVITPSCNALAGKLYKFNWETDNDYDNKAYRDSYGIGYGDYNFTVQSAFVTGERVYKMHFAQTIPTDELTPLVIPRIIQVDGGTKKPYKGKPRIYLYGGMKTGAWRLQNSNDSNGDNLTTYPSLHHFDNWENPTFDLNFGLVSQLYYTATEVTTDNLFNRFHRKFIVEITGKDGKLIDLFVKINSHMISTMDFGRLKMINGDLYKLNEINDFDSVTQETTEVVLLKTIDADNPAGFIPNPNVRPARKLPDIITSPSGPLISSPPYTGVIFSNSPGITNAPDETIYRSQ